MDLFLSSIITSMKGLKTKPSSKPPPSWLISYLSSFIGFPQWLSSKESAYHAGNVGLIPGSGRSPEEGNGNALQYSCLGNPMDRSPGRLQSMGLQGVGHNLVTKQQQESSLSGKGKQ